jgi:hypothetical protein
MSLEMACNDFDLVPLPRPESFEDEFEPCALANQLLARLKVRRKCSRVLPKNFSAMT